MPASDSTAAQDPLPAGAAKRVTIFVGESQHYHGRAAHQAVFEFLFYRRVAGATVTRGIAGFGADHHLHSADLLATSESLPIKIEFVDTPARVTAMLPKLRDMIGNGLITVQSADVYFGADAEKTAPTPAAAHVQLTGPGKLMRIYVSEKERWRGRPLHEVLVESLRAHDMAGVTVYRGIAGFGSGARADPGKDGPEKTRTGYGNPMMLSVVDTEERIRGFLPLLEQLLTSGLVVLSDVEVIKYMHRLPGPTTAPAALEPPGEKA